MGLRVLAAMSGGVDSATAAARAVDAGHEVTGVHLALSQNPQSYRTGARGCCTLEDARDARRAADVIGIPFYVWDMAERFARDVVDDFVAEYAAGRTPNPCLRCNEKIKFAAVLDRALALGFDAVCTGHYARIDSATGALQPGRRPGQGPVLRARGAHQGPDRARDVPARRHAQGRGPRGGQGPRPARRRQAGQPRRLLHRRRRHPRLPVPQARLGPGQIVDEDGTVLGAHDGAYGFTVGQRKGLRLDRPAPDGRPRYVLSIEPVSNTVTVGPRRRPRVREITAIRPVWTGCEPPSRPIECTVQLRAHGEVYPCTAAGSRRRTAHRPARPARAVAAGQAAVLYDGDTVLGSATISADPLN